MVVHALYTREPGELNYLSITMGNRGTRALLDFNFHPSASSWDSKGSVLTSLLGGGCAAQMGRQSGSAQREELAVPSSAPWALSLSPSVSSVMFTNSSWNPAAEVWEEGKCRHDVTGPSIIPVTQVLV